MKYVQSFDSFLMNESTIINPTKWDPSTETIEILYSTSPLGAMGTSGIRCVDGKVESFYAGPRGYKYALGVSCDENTWKKVAPEISKEINASIPAKPEGDEPWISGVVRKPIDQASKKAITAIIKKYI
jgi:hypothetical protein